MERLPMPLERSLRLDQGPRALVALGVFAQVRADQIADREHFGRGLPCLLALHRGVAAIARGVDDLGGLTPGVVKLDPCHRPQGQALPLATPRRVPRHEGGLAGALNADRQARASGIEMEHLGLASRQGQTLEIALCSEGHRLTLSLGSR